MPETRPTRPTRPGPALKAAIDRVERVATKVRPYGLSADFSAPSSGAIDPPIVGTSCDVTTSQSLVRFRPAPHYHCAAQLAKPSGSRDHRTIPIGRLGISCDYRRSASSAEWTAPFDILCWESLLLSLNAKIEPPDKREPNVRMV
jgi:hypothetical protein